jgi:hypothetical protein
MRSLLHVTYLDAKKKLARKMICACAQQGKLDINPVMILGVQPSIIRRLNVREGPTRFTIKASRVRKP